MHNRDMEKIYAEYAPTVYRFLFCLTHDRALSEDLTQETFFQAMKTIHRFRGECRLNVWLCQIAKRLWYKELKRKNRLAAVPIEDEKLISLQDLEAEYLKRETIGEFFCGLQSLDSSAQAVMYLRLVGELSFQDIADMLGKSAVWARVTFYRSKQKIAGEMKKGE